MAAPSGEGGEGRDPPRGGEGEEEEDGPVGTYSAVTPTTAGGTPPAGELKSHGAGGDPWAVPAAPDAVGETSGSDGTGPAPGPRRGPPPPRAGSGAPMAHEDYGHRVFVGGVPVRARPARPAEASRRAPPGPPTDSSLRCRQAAMDETALAAQFAHVDAVKDLVIMRNRATGQSKGYGFITFASRDGQQRAIAEMDGQTLVGSDGFRRKISVNAAVRPPRETRKTRN